MEERCGENDIGLPEEYGLVHPPISLLNSIRDRAMDSWLYFRTGNDKNEQTCLYISSGSESNSQGTMMQRLNLPLKKEGSIRFIIVSDTHTQHHTLGVLPQGDVFVHSGDILMSTRFWSSQGRLSKYEEFNEWLGSDAVNCPHKIIVGGNHDAELAMIGYQMCTKLFSNAIYLENTSTYIKNIDHSNGKGVYIYGTPCSRGRSGNSAFQSAEFETEAHQRADIEIEQFRKMDKQREPQKGAQQFEEEPIVLVTHGPCKTLRKSFLRKSSFKAHIWGHAHGAYGARESNHGILSICASIMDTRYCPTNAPIVMDLDL